MSVEPTPYTAELREYAIARSERDPVCEELAAESDALEGGALAALRMSPEQAALTTVLVGASGARRALEIGTFTGYGSIAIARGLSEDGLLVTCEISEEYLVLARRYWERLGLDGRIEPRIGPALETLQSLDAGSFDFAFIDADKESYPAYYEECLRLVRPGGLIAIDNVFWKGEVVAPGGAPTGGSPPDDAGLRAIRELNDRVAGDDRITSRAMASIADGLLLVVR